MEKSEIRRKVKALRVMLSDMEKRSAAEEVFSRLEQTAAFLLADHILMYHSLPDELYTHEFLGKWRNRKHFYLPRVNGVNLEILPYDESRLELGSFHIEEPTGDNVVDPEDIELIVVPAVAYDRNGNRLGRGKGFYDRLLQTTKATKVGVGYEFQLVDEVPVEPHDVGMDIIITQNATIIVK
ncbi:MAG: 5-formyltetrahydrofolate cyclo-ligase [Muribaculaceae bacterium]|nr:5-formyltetrahydrofolate cyclo-ligase [Muribaculaceae bacterium]MDE6008479.1 5-formyltetrahydrofolate cyclo-ligase [Muribaculaceae bacterium]